MRTVNWSYHRQKQGIQHWFPSLSEHQQRRAPPLQKCTTVHLTDVYCLSNFSLLISAWMLFIFALLGVCPCLVGATHLAARVETRVFNVSNSGSTSVSSLARSCVTSEACTTTMVLPSITRLYGASKGSSVRPEGIHASPSSSSESTYISLRSRKIFNFEP